MTRPEPAAVAPVPRRAMVAGAAALAGAAGLSACTGRDRGSTAPRTATGPGQARDVALAATALSEQRAVLERVGATVRAHPRLAGVLADTRSVHRAHVRLLARAVPPGTRRAGAAFRTAQVPHRAGDALSALAGAEEALAAAGRGHALAARSGAFARVLASAAAASSQQAVLLDHRAREAR